MLINNKREAGATTPIKTDKFVAIEKLIVKSCKIL